MNIFKKMINMLTSYNIFLDADLIARQVSWLELPDVNWTYVKNHEQFVDLILKNGLPRNISFGCDFYPEHNGRYLLMKAQPLSSAMDFSGLEKKCGVHSAQWLVEFCKSKNAYLPFYRIHSKNEFGAEAIKKILISYQVERSPLKLASKTQKIVSSLRGGEVLGGPIIDVRASVKPIETAKIEVGQFCL